MKYAEQVDAYIESVVGTDKAVVGKHQRYAVKRYLSDVENAGERGLYFDPDIATRACVFFRDYCTTTIGEVKPFQLTPWQVFCNWNIFGWRRKETGLRRFRKAYISVAAKSGKTTYAGGLANLVTMADEPFEFGAQTFIVSTALSQSMICYNECLKMVMNNPELRAMTKIYKSPHRIEIPESQGSVRPFPCSNKVDGYNLHCIVKDELHEWHESYREASDKLKSRMLARRQPIEITITTAGNQKSILWKQEDQWATRVVESVESGDILDDSLFSFIGRIDEGDDIFDPKVWVKANPNIGITVEHSMIAEDVNRAKHDPVERNRIIRYIGNREVTSSVSAIAPEFWATGAKPLSRASWEDGKGAVDLSATRDFTSIAACFPVVEDGVIVRHEAITKTWTCSDNRSLRLDREPFRTWIHQGKLHVMEGNHIVYQEIEDEIRRWTEVYGITQWAFDPNRALDIMDRMSKDGYQIFPFNQSHTKYNEACERFQEEVECGRLIHGNDPVLNWQIGNLEWEIKNNLRRPNKNNAASKIDAACALLMAFQGCLFAEKTAGSFYDNNEVEMG